MRRQIVPAFLGALAMLTPTAVATTTAAGGSAAATTLAVIHRPMSPHGVRNDMVQSTNWSGYAVSASSAFTSVTGTWVQPASTCSGRGTTYASFWVGIDGYSSNSVEQLGTDSDCSRGTPSYYAWYEMYPANSVSLSKTTYSVRPGDTLTGTVSRSGSSYTLTLTDTANGSLKWSFSTLQSGSNANSSAEWVAEAPELCSLFFCQLASLTNFGTVDFTNSKAAAGSSLAGITSYTNHEITMVTNSGMVKAQPSAVSGGTDFGDTWHHS